MEVLGPRGPRFGGDKKDKRAPLGNEGRSPNRTRTLRRCEDARKRPHAEGRRIICSIPPLPAPWHGIRLSAIQKARIVVQAIIAHRHGGAAVPPCRSCPSERADGVREEEPWFAVRPDRQAAGKSPADGGASWRTLLRHQPARYPRSRLAAGW